MVNLRIENSETVSMNVQHHIVELQVFEFLNFNFNLETYDIK